MENNNNDSNFLSNNPNLANIELPQIDQLPKKSEDISFSIPEGTESKLKLPNLKNINNTFQTDEVNLSQNNFQLPEDFPNTEEQSHPRGRR